MPMSRRYIWSELVPYSVVGSSAVQSALVEHGVTPVVAVRPGEPAAVARLVCSYREAGLEVALWPMLDDADGRWASAANAERFCGFVRALLDDLEARAATPVALAIDLEPPIERMRRLLRGQLRPPADRGAAAIGHYRALLQTLAERDISVFAAIVPPVLVGSPAARRGWQRFLETPVDALPFARLSAMLYTSLLEGYSRQLVSRADARALLDRHARAACDLFGERASVSLGAVGIGALGDEQTYRSLAEFGDDVAIVRAAGIDDIALFNLGGALARPPLSDWLRVLVTTPAATTRPPSTWRAALCWHFLRAAGRSADVLLGADRS